jgi:hypothetical protein
MFRGSGADNHTGMMTPFCKENWEVKPDFELALWISWCHTEGGRGRHLDRRNAIHYVLLKTQCLGNEDDVDRLRIRL